MIDSYDRRKTAAGPNVKAPMSAVAKAKELLGELESALKAFEKSPSEKTFKAVGSAHDKLRWHSDNKLGQAMAKLLDESDGRKAW